MSALESLPRRIFRWFGAPQAYDAITRRRAPGTAFLAVAAALLVATASAALLPTIENSYGTNCGNWLASDPAEARVIDGKRNSEAAYANLQSAVFAETTGSRYSNTPYTSVQEDSCMDAFASRRPWVILLASATVVAFAVGAIRRYQPQRQDQTE